MLCNTLYMLWGTPFVYNGEEIGMTNVDYTSLDQFKDVSAQNYAKFTLLDGRLTLDQILVHLRRSSRINSRTPMQWNDQKFAGFSLRLSAQHIGANTGAKYPPDHTDHTACTSVS